MIHQYKLGGYNIVLDVCSGGVHVVDDVAYDIISLFETTSREDILAAAREAEAAGRHDTLVVEIEGGWPYLPEPFVLSAKDNPELCSVDITLRGKDGDTPHIHALHRIELSAFEPVEGTVHGKNTGTKNVDAVYFLIIDNANRPCQRLTLNHFAQSIAFLLAQLLRVVQHVAFEVGRQDDGSGKHRPCKASATGFVATGLDNIFMMERQKHRLIS